ncbi:hypothetical protein [Brassicibacter mesophilus]|uniref:hypothetical protein n=1 Tax=Brassicibacter mesophilus TaxID=745119 RepID=UPI003D1D8C3C
MSKCYRPNCKCDEIKKKYCLFKMNKKQFTIYKAIHQKEICPECGELTINAKYKGVDIKLCTSCKHGLESKYRGRKIC